MNNPRGYDAAQMAAVLTYCLACHRWFYMTRPQPRCAAGADRKSDDEPAVQR